MERLSVYKPDIADVEPKLNSADLLVIQCVMEGWNNKEISVLGIDPKKAKAQIVDKMHADDSLETFLSSVERLPFVSQSMLSKTEGMVAFLVDARFRNVEISKTLGLARSDVARYKSRIKDKRQKQDDKNVPHISFLESDGVGIGLTKGIFAAIASGGVNTEIISRQPETNLSLNEARVLFLKCAGFTRLEIAQTLGLSVGTIQAYRNRISVKLGATRNYTQVAMGLNEMLRVQKQV